MRLGLLNGMGWAGAIGGVALCTLMFLFASIAFQASRKPDRVQTLPSVQEGRAALGRASWGAATPRATAPLPPGRGAPSPTSARPTPSGPGGGGDGR